MRQRGPDGGEVQLVRGPRVPQHVLCGEGQSHRTSLYVEGAVEIVRAFLLYYLPGY